jgi:hypothetical protein
VKKPRQPKAATPTPAVRRMTMPSVVPGILHKNPDDPVHVTKAEHMALKALEQGAASKEQQTLVLRWFVAKACRFYDVSSPRHGQDGMVFMEGRRFVGQQTLQILSAPVADDPDQPPSVGG